MNFITKKLRFDLYSVILLIYFYDSIKFAFTAQCRYYPLLTENQYYNTTCPEICCSGYSATPDGACCSPPQWNSGVYIGLSVPIFCCVVSIFGGFFYCCLIVKPKTKFFSDRHRLPDIRHRTVMPRELSMPTISNKDQPPSYDELYTNEVLSNKDNVDQLRQTSPCPPDYFIYNSNENTSSQSSH